MEEIIEATFTRKVHKIYCDSCNKFLLDAMEHDDGYYHNPYEVSFSYYHKDEKEWYSCKGVLCRKCRKEKSDEIITHLKALGFKATYSRN